MKIVEALKSEKSPLDKNDAYVKNIMKQGFISLDQKEGEESIDYEILNRLGCKKAIAEHQSKIDFQKKMTKFSRERLFHISQIKGTAIKYRLRFRPMADYTGIIDDALIEHAKTFEKEHPEINLIQTPVQILAPATTFKLSPKPKPPIDPLVFVSLGGGWYYLLHHWGNDVNTWRWIKSLPLRTKGWFNGLFWPGVTISLVLSIWGLTKWSVYQNLQWSVDSGLTNDDLLIGLPVIGVVALILIPSAFCGFIINDDNKTSDWIWNSLHK